jgi:hypothetical protein
MCRNRRQLKASILQYCRKFLTNFPKTVNSRTFTAKFGESYDQISEKQEYPLTTSPARAAPEILS